MVKIELTHPDDLRSLLSADEYEQYIAEEK
jgi:hypothetical protein